MSGRANQRAFAAGQVPDGTLITPDVVEDDFVEFELEAGSPFLLQAHPPLTPPNVVAEWLETSRIRVSWSPPTSNGSEIVDYTVENSSVGGSLISVSTTAEFEGLDPETSHSFRVRARNAAGFSQWSDYVAPAVTRSLRLPLWVLPQRRGTALSV